MSKKKDQKVPVSLVDEAQAREVLGKYRQIAQELHSSTDQQQAEAALTTITSMSEAAQMALLKLLSKELHSDAADILSAINELSPIKNVRKEARRSLIRLEEGRIYPQWESPVDRTPLVATVQTQNQLDLVANPPRFWKGFVTDTREMDEVQLLLLWEQGKDYKYVRVLGFLLEFLHDGVKDAFTQLESKRSVEKLIAETSARIDLLDCSLAKGRRLLAEALEVNKKHGTNPHRDYRLSLSLINELLLENPDIEEEEEDEDEYEETPAISELEPAQVVTGFVEAWVDGDFEYAYEFLASDSSLRQGLTQEEWAEQREEWAEEANPARLKPNFLHEREPQKSGIWLPNPFSRGSASTQKEIEIGWSIELADTTDTVDSVALPELPEGTTYYKETGRHWYWTSYTLVQEDGWRIQSMTNEGINVQGLPVAEIEKRISEHTRHIQGITKQHRPTDPDALTYFDEILWRSMQTIYYYDALFKYFPLDRELYMNAATSAFMLGEHERGLAYLEHAAEQFSEGRAEILRQMGAAQMILSEQYDELLDDEEDDEGVDYEVRSSRFKDLAEATYRELLRIDNSVRTHILLSNVLVAKGEDEELEEAEDLLLQAQALTSDQKELVVIKSRLGYLESQRQEYEKALSHYQRVVEMDPTLVSGWHDVGFAHQMLEHDEEAIANYRHAITLQPDNIDCYDHIADIYVKNGQLAEAREALEEGLQSNPDSVELLTMLMASYIESENFDRAAELLERAAEIDPDDETVRLYRQILKLSKQASKGQLLPPKKFHKK
ncbi:MAG: hypothetical protein NVSMB27_18060 [Ktedonobacteraceae bacterium]